MSARITRLAERDASRQAQDARAGMAWWNSLAPCERLRWLLIADSARPCDAWAAWKTFTPETARERGQEVRRP